MAGITLDDASRLHLAEEVIILLTLPDPPREKHVAEDPVPYPWRDRVAELAALRVIAVASELVQDEAARASIQNTIAPLTEALTEQVNERLGVGGMRAEALTVSSGGVGLGSLSEWDLLAMVVASQRHGFLPKVQ